MTTSSDKFPKYQAGIQLVQDVSSLSLGMTCGYKYKLRQLEGWRPKVEKASKSWGTIVHAGMQEYDTQRFLGTDKDTTVLRGIETILNNCEGYNSDDSSRTALTATRVIVWRAEERWNEDYRIAAMPDGSPALEVRFEVPFSKDKRLSGRIDKLAYLGDNLYIVDTKTTKSLLSDYFFDLYALDNQLFAYLWAARRVMGLPVSGFVIDGIQTGVNFTRFGSRTYRKTDTELDQWYKDMQFELEILETMHQRNYFPQRRTACNMYNGCEFKEVCKLPHDHHKTWLSTLFEQSLHPTLQEPANAHT